MKGEFEHLPPQNAMLRLRTREAIEVYQVINHDYEYNGIVSLSGTEVFPLKYVGNKPKVEVRMMHLETLNLDGSEKV